MPAKYKAPPANPACFCFCCGQHVEALLGGPSTYEERTRHTFVPRRDGQKYWCDDCEKQRCPNMPGANHHRLYRYIPLKRAADKTTTADLIPIGTVINTVGPYRESLT